MTGGRGGIRTLGGFNPTAAFQATALNHYATRPSLFTPFSAKEEKDYLTSERTAMAECAKLKIDPL